jgi:NhaA family Na+:H+ antiporter
MMARVDPTPGGDLALPVNEDDHFAGNPDAPVVLVEYGDYECPYCGQAFPSVQMLRRQFGGSLAFVFRNFPLVEAHPHALIAAAGAEAAALQGRFWPMHDTLFTHQHALEPEHLMLYARGLDLDLERFVADANSERVARRIQRDIDSGVASGVPGTPTFFVNGRRHTGSFAPESLGAAIERALVAAGARRAS